MPHPYHRFTIGTESGGGVGGLSSRCNAFFTHSIYIHECRVEYSHEEEVSVSSRIPEKGHPFE